MQTMFNFAVQTATDDTCLQTAPQLALQPSKAEHIFTAAQILAGDLARNQSLDATTLRHAMTSAFGSDETTGAWTWRDAYDASEVAASWELNYS